MRLIDVSTPLGKSSDVAALAFAAGIEKVSVQQAETRRENGASTTN